MYRLLHVFFAPAVLILAAALLSGCTEGQTPPPATSDEESPQADAAQLDPEVEESLAALSPADREAALKQKICPVSGEPLGSMGTPRKVLVEGREVFTCCEGCDDALKENPEEYLAKLPAE